jgi:hypothetical protein
MMLTDPVLDQMAKSLRILAVSHTPAVRKVRGQAFVLGFDSKRPFSFALRTSMNAMVSAHGFITHVRRLKERRCDRRERR